MTKLLLTLDFPPEPGGIQQYLYNIVKYEYKKSDTVLVGCKSPDLKKSLNLNVRIYKSSLPILSFLNKKISLIPMLFNFFKIIQKNTNIEINCGNVYSAIIPFICYPFIKKKYFIYIYGTEIIQLKKKSLKNIFLKAVLSKADTIYAITKYAEKCLRNCSVKTPVKIIHPKIDKPKHNPPLKKITNHINFLSVGRLVKHKGHHILIKSFYEFIKTQNATLTIIGSGPEYKSLNKLIEKLNIKNRVRLLTKLSDEQKNIEYKNSTIFILPSIETIHGTEGFGIVLLEAMSWNIPIIASDTGGITEVLDNGKYGMLVEPNDAKKLLLSMIKLSKDKDLYFEYSKNSRNHLLKKYVW